MATRKIKAARTTAATAAPDEEKTKRNVVAIYSHDAARIAKIQAEIWTKNLSDGLQKKPSAADVINFLLEKHDNEKG